MIISRPIDSTRDAVPRLVGQGSGLGRSLFGARRRSVLSTVGASGGATAGLRKTHDGHHGCQARGALTQRRLYIGNPSEITDTRMVHQ
ncbi:hypothetical protein IU21_08210 [Mycobacterium tuberculosis]|nr:hypothetical protein IU21_08210 [Mycobacterium tuberculosis]